MISLPQAIALTLAGLTATFSSFAADPAKPVKPNIVFILIDDMGMGDLSAYGSPLCRTPNIDGLAAEGMRFTNAYAACTVCSPTRSSLLTGQYPARLHITDWIPGHDRPWEKLSIPDWNVKGISKNEMTLPAVLKKQGYASVALGKWHLGKVEPTDVGFDQGKEDWTRNRVPSETDPKGVFSLTQEALAFAQQHKDQPFFIYLAHYAVHGPVFYDPVVEKRYVALAPPQSPIKPAYAAMTQALDDSVGILLAGLKALGVADNTLVIFYSDNGGLLANTTNAPYRKGKGHPYDGGLRVPLIARWPGHIAPGKLSAEVITSVDFLPTLAEAAGATQLPPVRDGLSLMSVLEKGAPLNREAIYWHYPHYHDGPPASAIRKGDFKLIEFLEDGRKELYNLAKDPGETTDLAAKMPEKTAELSANLNAWRQSVGAQMMKPNPNYDPQKAGKKGTGKRDGEG